jgi:hypothetical protein
MDRNPSTRFVTALLVALFMLPTTGCWVFSVYPVTTAETRPLEKTERLTGKWKPDDENWTLTITAKDQPNQFSMKFVSRDSVASPSDGPTAFEGNLFRVGDVLFFDIVPSEGLLMYLPLHSFFKVKVEEDRLTLWGLNEDWLKAETAQECKSLEKIAINPSGDVKSSLIVSPGLQQCLKIAAKNPNAFYSSDPFVYTRDRGGN